MKRKLILLLFLLIIILFVVGQAIAQGTGYEITWWSVDSGGAVAKTGNGYSLSGSIGQADAGQPINGDSYSIQGGFWTTPEQNLLFVPYVRNK
jgi:hypothetical protein